MEWGIKETFARLPPIPRNLLLLERLTFIHYSWPQLSYRHAASRVHSSSLSLPFSLRFALLACKDIVSAKNTNTSCKRMKNLPLFPVCASRRRIGYGNEEESDREGIDSIRVQQRVESRVFFRASATFLRKPEEGMRRKMHAMQRGRRIPSPLLARETRMRNFEWKFGKEGWIQRGMFLRFNDYRLKLQVGEIHEARGK